MGNEAVSKQKKSDYVVEGRGVEVVDRGEGVMCNSKNGTRCVAISTPCELEHSRLVVSTKASGANSFDPLALHIVHDPK